MEQELQLQISLKMEMEMAMRLLEKDIHEKQDTIISLRKQLEDIKSMNIDLYKKIQVRAIIVFIFVIIVTTLITYIMAVITTASIFIALVRVLWCNDSFI